MLRAEQSACAEGAGHAGKDRFFFPIRSQGDAEAVPDARGRGFILCTYEGYEIPIVYYGRRRNEKGQSTQLG